ncbi:MAG: HEAT repeat domain-containing protein [Pseudomonadota bacterium]
MRLKALAALTQEVRPIALETLRATLGDGDTIVLNRVIERLGKIGTASDLQSLKEVRTGNRTTQRILRSAKCFLSYRHGLGQYRHDVPSRVFKTTNRDSAKLGTGVLSKSLREQIELRGMFIPGIDLALDHAWRVECPNRLHIFIANRELIGTGIAALTERQTVLGVLVAENLEIGTFEPFFYLLTDPATRDTFHIFGVRSAGWMTLYGSGRYEDGVVDASLSATSHPSVPPLNVDADYAAESDRLRFRRGIVETRLAESQTRQIRRPRPD